MSKSVPVVEAITTATNTPTFFIRPSIEADGPISGKFQLEGIDSVLVLHEDDTIQIFKLLKDGSMSAKPIAVGSMPRTSSPNPDFPTRRGFVETSKGTRFNLVAWEHDIETEPYYTVQYSTLPKRQGKFY